ncbi:MAG: molybdenum cofactor biosynthesis protein B [Alteromonadaceae bacterium]|nr:molybdenum cofactor biosynthesis protein B [Alteromonadaceae bacterium]
MSAHSGKTFIPLNIAILTVSDTRDESNDTSGQALVERITEAGHHLAEKAIVKDDVYQLRAIVSKWIADDNIQAVISTGGTGFTPRDNTPEALTPLFDKAVEGFGEVFRYVSLQEIGTSTIQSRAFGGIANSTVIFCVPGSTNACKTAWDKVIKEQLDASHRPCNFVPHLKIPTEQVEQCESRG